MRWACSIRRTIQRHKIRPHAKPRCGVRSVSFALRSADRSPSSYSYPSLISPQDAVSRINAMCGTGKGSWLRRSRQSPPALCQLSRLHHDAVRINPRIAGRERRTRGRRVSIDPNSTTLDARATARTPCRYFSSCFRPCHQKAVFRQRDRRWDDTHAHWPEQLRPRRLSCAPRRPPRLPCSH